MFKKLTNSQAGELIKMIFAHETGETFKTKDLAVDIAFTSIQQHLNRDSKKWSGTIHYGTRGKTSKVNYSK